jgi:hypothetical protein
MITAIGTAADPTFAHFVRFATAKDKLLQVIDLRALLKGNWKLTLPKLAPSFVILDGDHVELDPAGSYFCRLIDLSPVLPPADAAIWRAMVSSFAIWLDAIPARVVNRPSAAPHNSSKPLHEAVLGQLGFKVPRSITSSHDEELLDFVHSTPCVIKSLSGARGDTVLIEPDMLRDFSTSAGPIHLQAFVQGDDLRVHVLGQRCFAEIITSSTVDYRTRAARTIHAPYALPESTQDKLTTATKTLGLDFAGWDFKISAGELICLEVNPMPGYSVYDRRCDAMISKALINFLLA